MGGGEGNDYRGSPFPQAVSGAWHDPAAGKEGTASLVLSLAARLGVCSKSTSLLPREKDLENGDEGLGEGVSPAARRWVQQGGYAAV